MLFTSFQIRIKNDGIIEQKAPQLIGEYEFICSYDDKNNKTDRSTIKDVYSLKITKRDQLIISKNGRKLEKYFFSDVEVPITYETEFIMFRKEDQFYPMFYKGDTVVLHLTPISFQDNYFRKIKK